MSFEKHNKDTNSLARMLAATSHKVNGERDLNDFYATPPKCVKFLLDKLDKYNERDLGKVWEPCAGMNHITNVLRENGYEVVTSDLNVLEDGVIEQDFFTTDENFLKENNLEGKISIVTNPPYKFANDWYKHAMEILPEGGKLIQFVKIQFLETGKRYELFMKWKPKYIWALARRYQCAQGGDFKGGDGSGGIAMYCWVLTEKGYNGETIFDWIEGV